MELNNLAEQFKFMDMFILEAFSVKFFLKSLPHDLVHFRIANNAYGITKS